MSVANAQTLSFRSRALGSVIDDDLDLVYDPIELKFVEGSRLYTNLSNLTSSYENVFDNVTDDTYLIGFSGKCPLVENLWRAILIEFENSKSSNYVNIDSDLDGWYDIDGFGTLIDEFTAYEDTSGDDIYDSLTKISQEKSDFTDTSSINFILNHTYDLGSAVIGGRIKYTQSCYDHYIDYNLDFTHRKIMEDFVDVTMDGLEDEDYTDEFSTLDFLGSVLLPDVNGYEIRGDVNYNSSNTSWKIDEIEEFRTDWFDQDITGLEDYETEQQTFELIDEEKGSSFAIGGSIRKTTSQAAERKNDGYWKIGAGVNFGSFDYTDSEKYIGTYTEKYFNGLDTLQTDYIETYTETENITDDGTNETFGYIIKGKVNIPLDEKVYFGIGGSLAYNQSKRETDYTESIENIEDYEVLDEEATAADYTITETCSMTGDRTYEFDQTVLTLPVGIEYKFTNNNKWAGRFGAIFRNVFSNTNDAIQITGTPVPFTTLSEYGDGTEDVEINDNIFESTSEHINTAYSNTNFYYGLGFNPTDKMQIDLLGFFDGNYDTLQDFIQGLRFSFTLLFD